VGEGVPLRAAASSSLVRDAVACLWGDRRGAFCIDSSSAQLASDVDKGWWLFIRASVHPLGIPRGSIEFDVEGVGGRLLAEVVDSSFGSWGVELHHQMMGGMNWIGLLKNFWGNFEGVIKREVSGSWAAAQS
jgi:hypothetical protein